MKKIIVLILMLSSLLSFNGCSQSKEIIREKEVPILPGDDLLASACDVTDVSVDKGGKVSVRALGKAYAANWYCVEAHQKTLIILRDWKAKQQELYKDK